MTKCSHCLKNFQLSKYYRGKNPKCKSCVGSKLSKVSKLKNTPKYSLASDVKSSSSKSRKKYFFQITIRAHGREESDDIWMYVRNVEFKYKVKFPDSKWSDLFYGVMLSEYDAYWMEVEISEEIAKKIYPTFPTFKLRKFAGGYGIWEPKVRAFYNVYARN